MKIASMLLIIALTLLVYNASGRRLPDSPHQWTLAFLIVSCAGMLLGMSFVGWTYSESSTWLSLLADIALGVLVFMLPFRVIQWLAEKKHLTKQKRPAT